MPTTDAGERSVAFVGVADVRLVAVKLAEIGVGVVIEEARRRSREGARDATEASLETTRASERDDASVKDDTETPEAIGRAADLRFATATLANEGIAALAKECLRLEKFRADADARLALAKTGELGVSATNRDSVRRESIRSSADARLAAANVAEEGIAAIDAETSLSRARRQAADDRLVSASEVQ